MNELSPGDWNAKILKALKENSRRFARTSETVARQVSKTSQRVRKSSAKKTTNGRRR